MKNAERKETACERRDVTQHRVEIYLCSNGWVGWGGWMDLRIDKESRSMICVLSLQVCFEGSY